MFSILCYYHFNMMKFIINFNIKIVARNTLKVMNFVYCGIV